MKIETFPQDDHQVKIEAEFDADLFEGYKRRAARKIAQKAKVPGFRPGKAPYEVIHRIYGEGAISEEAVELLIDEQYAKVLEESSVEPSGPGALQEIVSLDPLKLSFLVPLKPEVEIGNYKDIKLEYNLEPISEDTVSEFLTRLQKNYATAEPVDRPIEKGDVVYFKVTGYENDETVLDETPVQLVVGEDKNKDNWPFENFSKKLIGLKEGESKDIRHTFKEDAEEERFKSKKIKFNVIIQSVKTLTLPELDDEFAKSLGQFESMEELKNAIHDQEEANKKQEYEDQYFADLLDKYAEISTVKFPPFMVEEEIHHSLHALERNLKRENLDFETYLKLMNMDKEQFIETNLRPAAIRRIRNSLIIDKLGLEEKIEVGKEDIDGILQETAQRMQSLPAQKGKKAKSNDQVASDIAYNSISQLYNQRTLERMKALANGEPIEEKSAEPESATPEAATDSTATPETEVESIEEVQSSDSTGEEAHQE